MYEKRHQRLLPIVPFAQRVIRSLLVTALIVFVSLSVGTIGYCYFGNLLWDDGLLNASMILTGMGPVDRMTTRSGKLFSSFYALYSGLAFISMVTIMVAPIYHRFLHYFHFEDENRE